MIGKEVIPLFYLFLIFILIYNLMLYVLFRFGIVDSLRVDGMSKTAIKKLRKGAENYWFFRAIHEKKSLGFLYPLNIVYTWSTLVFSLSGLILGCIPLLQPVFWVCSILICLIQFPAIFLASNYHNQAEFGCAFILLAISKRVYRGIHSSLMDYSMPLVTVILIYFSYSYL